MLAFSSGHIIRIIAARWLGLPPSAGRCFFCQPGSVGVLGFEHESRDEPIVELWNSVNLPSTTPNRRVDHVEKTMEKISEMHKALH